MSPLYRIYKCSRCEYIDYTLVTNEETVNQCSLCGNEINHTPNTMYTSSEDKAIKKAKMLVQSKSIKHPSSKPTRGLGDKRRILRMLLDLVDINNGQPVYLSDVIQECAHAGISKDRVIHFIDILSSEGIIQNHANCLTVEKEAVV